MKPFILPLVFFILLPHLANAQVIRGKVTGTSGEPVPYATIYIQELKQGTTANTRGVYEIRLPPGKYLLICQSLGFEPMFAEIVLSDKDVTKDFILPEQYYEIPEVRISASGEDPAYVIMRKVIGLAPYYLNQISHYKADVYLKGNLVIGRIPKIMERAIRMEARSSSGGASVSSSRMKEGDSFFMESFNEIEFTAPDKYVQKVISYNSTFPDEGNEISPMDFIQASLYQPIIADLAISPLSPDAFSHYNFRYLGSSPQGNFVINKIGVRPKRKSQQLFTGTIFIIEDLWCLHSVDLTNENIVGKIRLQQVFIPIQEDVWMPVSHTFDVDISIIGFKAVAGYGSSVKYNEVVPNASLSRPSALTTDFRMKNIDTDTIGSRSRKQIEKILQKEELTNRDMARLSRLMEKESGRSVSDSIRNSLEVSERTTYIIQDDAAAKDSAWWAGVRPVPLSDVERRSLAVADSTKSLLRRTGRSGTDTVPETTQRKTYKTLTTVKNITFGHTWTDSKGFRFMAGGLIDLKKISFNTVDGFVYGTDFRISKSWKEKGTLSLYPDFRWAFSRQALMWRVNTNYSFNGMKQRQIFIRAGITSKDLNSNGGINPFLNAEASLFLKRNYLKLYESRYILSGYSSEITNGLNIELTAGFEERRVLENTTSFAFFGSLREYSDNVPVNEFLDPPVTPYVSLRDQKHMDFTVSLQYTPFQKYRISGGNKIPSGSDWPTFRLIWKHGVNEFAGLSDDLLNYDMFRFEVSKRRNIGAFSEFVWRFRTGTFINNTTLPWYDFFHFNTQPLPFLINNYEDAFRLPDYYSLSTSEPFGEFHLKYTSPYLLLKLLPGLSNTLMRENITLSWLGSRYHSHYTEIGYTMSEIFLLGEAGIWAGFDNLRYRSIGFKIILRL
jgi:hypothetical protein